MKLCFSHFLQTFGLYAGIPMRAILSTELRYFGILKFLFAGEVAATAFYLLDNALETAIEKLRDVAIQRYASQGQPESRRTCNIQTIKWLEYGYGEYDPLCSWLT